MLRIKPVAALSITCALWLLLLAGCSEQDASARVAKTAAGVACGVSELKANPEKYLGDITLSGKTARVYPEDSVVEIADERACCAVHLFVPFTETQRAKLGAEHLYQGTLPAVGAPITAEAELAKVEKGYILKVKEIRSGDQVLVAMK